MRLFKNEKAVAFQDNWDLLRLPKSEKNTFEEEMANGTYYQHIKRLVCSPKYINGSGH